MSSSDDTPAEGPYEHRDGEYVPLLGIRDWSVGGPADRLYDNAAQARADIRSLLGLHGEEGPDLEL